MLSEHLSSYIQKLTHIVSHFVIWETFPLYLINDFGYGFVKITNDGSKN